MPKEDFIINLNKLLYDIDPYNYIDDYGSLENGLDALRDVLHDYDTMKAILSFIYDVMDESPGLIISEEELRTVTSLMEHVDNIKR